MKRAGTPRGTKGLAAVLVALLSGAGCWESTPLTYYPNFYEVAFGSGIYVAVGEEGVIATSADGRHWELSPAGVTTDLYCVVFFRDHFVVGSKDGPLLWSTDGIVWNQVPGWNVGLRDFAICGETLWAVGSDGTIASTTDGETWQIHNSGTAWLWRVACNDTTVVAVEGGWNGALTSTDGGLTWTRTEIVGASHCGLVFGAEWFVTVSTSGEVHTSLDGFTWTLTGEALWESGLNVPCGLAFNGEWFALVNWEGYLYVSVDAVTWTALSYPDMGKFTLVDIWPHAGGFIAVGAGEMLEVTCAADGCSASKPYYVSVPWPDWIPRPGSAGSQCGGTTCGSGAICVSSRTCIDGAYSCECAGSSAGQCVNYAANGFPEVQACGTCTAEYTACCAGDTCVNGTCLSPSQLPEGCTAQ